MEPERKIEKLLRAYAKKRRVEAGDPLKLHPATRRLLQGEVVRRAGKPDEEEASLSLWDLFRQQWVFLLGFALVMFFAATMFLPALSKAKNKAQSVTAMNNLKQIGVAAQIAAVNNNGKLPASLDALTNELGSDKILSDPESGKHFAYAAGGVILDDLQSNSVLAYSPEDKKGRAVLFADGNVQRLRREDFSGLTNRGLLLFAAAENSPRGQINGMAPAAPVLAGTSTTTFSGELAASAVKADGFTAGLPQANSVKLGLNNLQRFVQTVAATAKTPPVLASFELQQNGNAISVVDRDGSVYSGTWQLAAADMPRELDRTKESLPQTMRPPQNLEKDVRAAKNKPTAAQNYSFRVTGQNRTLKQNIVFVGNMVVSNAQNNAQPPGGRNFGGGGGGGQFQSAAANAAQQAVFSNSRIAGTVLIDETNKIEINALPVTP
jgi:type II secretory pathway pseudopilin PulG